MCHWPLAVWCCPGFRVGLGASFASLGRLPASLFSPICRLGCLLAIRGAVPCSASASPGSCTPFPLHARWRSTLCAKTWPLGWGCLLSCAPPRGCLWLRCAPFLQCSSPTKAAVSQLLCVRALFFLLRFLFRSLLNPIVTTLLVRCVSFLFASTRAVAHVSGRLLLERRAPSVSDVAGLMGMPPGCVLKMVSSCGCAGARGVPFFSLARNLSSSVWPPPQRKVGVTGARLFSVPAHTSSAAAW
jgi:hypothetical protein